MNIFLHCRIRNSFENFKLISIGNKELQHDKVTKFFFEQIQDEIKSRNIEILDSGFSSKNLFFIVSDKDAFNGVNKLCSRSFARCKIEECKNEYITVYHIHIEIKNIENLIQELSKQSIYPIYKASKTLPESEGNILKVKFYGAADDFKKLIEHETRVSIRFIGYGNDFKTYEGKTIKASDPISRDFFGHNLIDKFSLHDDVVVMHLSAFGIGELNNIKINGGGNICFESGGVIYAQMSIREGKPIKKDLQFVKCRSKQEALFLMSKLSLGSFSSFQIIEEKEVHSNLKFLFYFFCLLVMALFIFLFLKIKNQKTLLSLIISNIAFCYFSYNKSFLDTNFFIVLILQQIIFFIINEKEDEIKLFGFYLSIIYFSVNLFIFGLSNILNNYFFEYLTNRSIMSSFIILISYGIIKAIKSKKEDIMTNFNE